ncbi:tripartite tricarboxylate transporter substrate binding protein [Candidatus Berkelbacteria bacterium]|nr:tripartite tricarboxylate transporter substrate binding protein [Candidatus Berkelbacteria bacterium]
MRIVTASMALLIAIFQLSPVSASGADFPTKPVRFLVAFPPGGIVDVMARILSPHLTELWGQQTVVDNRGGANGIIGTEVLAKSTPDGYTMLMGTLTSHAINASLYKKLPYDTVKDFTFVTLVGSVTNVLVVVPSVPIHSVRDLIKMAKAKPNSLSFASFGTGSSAHLAGELFKSLAKVEMTHIPYKGGPLAITGMLSGEAHLMFSSVPPALPHLKAGKLRAVAVTGAKRSRDFPQLPTISEEGLKGFDVNSWYAVIAPKGLPKGILDKLNTDLVSVINLPEVRKKLEANGVEVATSSPQGAAEVLEKELVLWAKVIKISNTRIDQ